MTDQTTNRPVDTLRDGKLKATIWRNEGETGAFYAVTLSRLFEKDDALHDGHSFTGGDLLKVAELARKAYEQIRQLKVEDRDRLQQGEQTS